MSDGSSAGFTVRVCVFSAQGWQSLRAIWRGRVRGFFGGVDGAMVSWSFCCDGDDGGGYGGGNTNGDCSGGGGNGTTDECHVPVTSKEGRKWGCCVNFSLHLLRELGSLLPVFRFALISSPSNSLEVFHAHYVGQDKDTMLLSPSFP